MNYKQILTEYSQKKGLPLINNQLFIRDNIIAETTNIGIEITDKRFTTILYLLEENTSDDKSQGQWYSTTSEEYYNTLDEFVEYILSGKLLKNSKGDAHKTYLQIKEAYDNKRS
ncbi:MAG: hypothetical protein IJS61_09800 [Firmicutes bacterium]|nr:hypothetical protein [Bacillota bacterium]